MHTPAVLTRPPAPETTAKTQHQQTIVVTGGTSGIGRGLVQRLAKGGSGGAAPPALVVATAREPTSPAAQAAQATMPPNVRILKLDVTDEASVSSWADEVAALASHVDLCVLNAGVYGSRGGLLDLTAADFELAFRTNATGPFLVVQALLRRGLLGAASANEKKRPFPRELLLGPQPGASSPGALPPLRADADGGVTSVLALMSSVMASHGDPVVSAVAPGGHAYRSSKAALNQIGHAFCVGLAPEGVATTFLHPGYVKNTNMTGDQGWISVDESVDGLEALLTGGKKGEVDDDAARPLHGRWWHAATLEEIPW